MNDDDQVILPNEELPEEDVLHEELATGEGMVTTPDDLPKARLVLTRGGGECDDIFEIHHHATIGRRDDALGPVDVDFSALPEGVYVSRRHAEIRNEDGKWMLKDLGSSNGTFVMGDADFEQIQDETEIHDGQQISFGNVRFTFHEIHPTLPPNPAPEEQL
jgi:pSer/pThr/pTyr-binding forkhead associated (FHA) protein